MKKYNLSRLLFCFTLLFISCGTKQEINENSSETGTEMQNSNSTSLTAVQARSIQLETAAIGKKQLTASLKANGILKVPNQNRATITALMGGVVRSILVQTGNNVQKGSVIATIANPAFIKLQEDYISAAAQVQLGEQEYKRQQELHAGNATALKIVQASEAELKTLKARKASLQKQLELIGINAGTLTSDNMQPVVNITSPITGAVSNVSVNIGTYVEANNPIAEVIDNGQLHLDLFVYERDLTKLKEGQTIHFTLTNNPGREYDAKVYAISNTFAPDTKAVTVHATVEGDKTGLIDGMNITALVSLENATVDAVPTEAIVSYQGQDFIFIQTDGQTQNTLSFERIPVRKGTTDVGFSEITVLKDIPADAKVVTKGAFFILAKMTNSGEHE